jgi:hypothetical protein
MFSSHWMPNLSVHMPNSSPHTRREVMRDNGGDRDCRA